MAEAPGEVVIHARRSVVDDAAGEVPRTIRVRDGVIVAIEPFAPRSGDVHLADDEVLLPGLVDTHVHVNEPGRTDWEGFRSATRAAAAGGVTTILDMPLNSIPPTCDVAALDVKREAADGECFVDVGFWGGAIPANLGELRALHDAGVFGFKSFLSPSGVEEFPHLSPDQLAAAMREAAALGAMIIVHAEDPGEIDRAPQAGGRTYADFLASRPPEAENAAIGTLIALAEATGARTHLLHLSSAAALEQIATARSRPNVDLSVETCPHYLALSAEEIPDGDTAYKCCPPIRDADNQAGLWRALADGRIDFVVSDHSPATVELKRPDSGDFETAWGGISSLQLGLSLVWNEARRRGFGLADVVRWMSGLPAARVGLARKGRIAVGCDADFAVFAPDEPFDVDPRELFHKNPVTPYAGRRLRGRVRRTWLRGRDITADVTSDRAPVGRLLTHSRTEDAR